MIRPIECRLFINSINSPLRVVSIVAGVWSLKCTVSGLYSRRWDSCFCAFELVISCNVGRQTSVLECTAQEYFRVLNCSHSNYRLIQQLRETHDGFEDERERARDFRRPAELCFASIDGEN